MPISLMSTTDSPQRDKALDVQINTLTSFITPDPEVFWTEEDRLKGGLSKLDAAISMAQGSVNDLKKRLKNKSYEDPQMWRPGENAETVRQAWEAQIKEQTKDIEKFNAQKILIPKQIKRLEKLKTQPIEQLVKFEISPDTPRENISALQKTIQNQLKKSPQKTEVLNEILTKLDFAKTAIDSNVPFEPVTAFVNNSEAKMLQQLMIPPQKNDQKAVDPKQVTPSKNDFKIISSKLKELLVTQWSTFKRLLNNLYSGKQTQPAQENNPIRKAEHTQPIKSSVENMAPEILDGLENQFKQIAKTWQRPQEASAQPQSLLQTSAHRVKTNKETASEKNSDSTMEAKGVPLVHHFQKIRADESTRRNSTAESNPPELLARKRLGN